ncbi:MAG: hypothetical protein KKB62_00225 [Nanoarchaeota archaeon]|nr:hypothetical protein [Nanoarchaeota archaeon]
MEKRTKNILKFLAFAVILTGWILLFKYVNPQLLVAKIGATNGYLVLLLIGAIGGASIFTGPSYFVAVTTLALVGLNPFLLGLCGGIGVTIGDTIIFLMGIGAGKKAPGKIHEKLEKMKKFTEKKPKWFVNLVLFLYVGLTPLPNEVATISMGMIGHNKKMIIFIILLGNITSGILGALLVQYGASFF